MAATWPGTAPPPPGRRPPGRWHRRAAAAASRAARQARRNADSQDLRSTGVQCQLSSAERDHASQPQNMQSFTTPQLLRAGMELCAMAVDAHGWELCIVAGACCGLLY